MVTSLSGAYTSASQIERYGISHSVCRGFNLSNAGLYAAIVGSNLTVAGDARTISSMRSRGILIQHPPF